MEDVQAFMSTAPGKVLRPPPASVIESDSESESAAASSDDDAMSFKRQSVASSIKASPKAASRRRVPQKSRASETAEKGDLLYKIDRMRKRGIGGARTLSIDDDLEDIQVEFARLTKNANVDKSIAFQRSLLISFASGAEYLNSTFDPAGIKLDGWSEHLNDSMDNFDDVLEDLAEKWMSGPSGMPPELKLVFMIVSSGAMFHLQSTMFKSAPGMDEVMKENPELARDFAAATARSMAKSGKATGPQKSMAGMMGGMFGNSASSVPRPSTQDVDDLLGEEDLFSESSGGSAAGSILDELEQELQSNGPIVMDI